MRGLILFGALLAGCGDKEDTGEEDTTPVDDTGTDEVDADGDGFIADNDCDDSDPEVNPGAEEVCDEVDNDCDGFTDEGLDADLDGYTPCGGDCDDDNASVSPGVDEVCDGQDNNCDGEIDEGGLTVYYTDADGDGYGDPATEANLCEPEDDSVENGDDCDDSSATTHPGAAELDSKTDCMADADDDGYGDDGASGDVVAGTDCDDTSDAAVPGGIELCDGLDNDCDGVAETVVSHSTDFDGKLTDWTLNGDAQQVFDGKDGFLLLTEASGSQEGTAFLTDPIPTDSFAATFTIEIGGGNGADGMVFLFLDESDPTIASTCSGGSCLGAYGFSGYGVEFDTYLSSSYGDTNGNHIAIIDTADFGVYATDGSIPTLSDGGEFDVEVYYTQGDIEVYFDGSLSMATTLKDYALTDVLFGFSAATGGLTNAHAVRSFSLDVCSE